MRDLWAAATRHPFLDGVRDGSLPVAAVLRLESASWQMALDDEGRS